MMDDGTYDNLPHKWFFVKAADKEWIHRYAN